jgi:NAD(P)-dependent dehydrogenase (short-subunit alcohol dehydrogenase family)
LFFGSNTFRKYVQRAWYTKTNRIDGHVVIITGCNTGLGKAAAIEIAKRGAKLYLACRDMAKCEEVRQEIVKLSSNPSVYARELDLGSLESVRKFSERFHKEENRLDILMNNAGIFMVPQAKTKDGFEQVMGVNHLGHFLLTNLLLDLLKVWIAVIPNLLFKNQYIFRNPRPVALSSCPVRDTRVVSSTRTTGCWKSPTAKYRRTVTANWPTICSLSI